MLASAFQLVALKFKRSYVAAASVFLIGTRLTALIGLVQMPKSIGAAGRVARINCRASGRQSLGQCQTAVVLQGAQQRIGIIQIASIVEVAATITAQEEQRSISPLVGRGSRSTTPRSRILSAISYGQVSSEISD